MKILRCAVLPAVALALWGCIPAFLHPGYTAQDVVVDGRLVGTWTGLNTLAGVGSPDTISFRLDAGEGYRVTYRQSGQQPDSLVFLGHLFRVGTSTLVDLEPHPSNVVSALYLPAHTFWMARLAGDTLHWGGLKLDWALAAARRGVPVCPVDTLAGSDDVVFTCGTPGVRRLLADAVADSSAFSAEPMLRLGEPARR